MIQIARVQKIVDALTIRDKAFVQLKDQKSPGLLAGGEAPNKVGLLYKIRCGFRDAGVNGNSTSRESYKS